MNGATRAGSQPARLPNTVHMTRVMLVRPASGHFAEMQRTLPKLAAVSAEPCGLRQHSRPRWAPRRFLTCLGESTHARSVCLLRASPFIAPQRLVARRQAA